MHHVRAALAPGAECSGGAEGRVPACAVRLPPAEPFRFSGAPIRLRPKLMAQVAPVR